MIWEACNGQTQIKPLSGSLFRLVESQEQIATLGYVDTLEEQAVLEELLEESKPQYPQGRFAGLHYLLKTPFRYPPLEWGSRFGRRHEPSLFYGGESLVATLAESAYCRFVFLHAIDGKPPSDRLNTEHSLFRIGYSTERGIQLQVPPFANFSMQLTHPSDYTAPQLLGSDMRAAGVEAFQYQSARSIESSICGALFTPTVFTGREPDTLERWFCELTENKVTFKSAASSQIYQYPRTQFEVDGVFPLPA